MNLNNKTFVDVTHIASWNGSLTGVERVEYYLIKYYFDNTDAGFISWSDVNGRFEIYPKSKVKNSILNRAHLGSRDTGKSLINKLKSRLGKAGSGAEAFSGVGRVIIPAGMWDKQDYIDGVIELSNNAKIVHLIHDMIPLTQKGYVVDYLPDVFQNYMAKILPACHLIISNSESTANDAKKVFKVLGLNLPPVEPFRMGDNINSHKPTPVANLQKNGFILSVGTIEARKNHYLLYYLQKKLLSEGKKPVPVVLAGRRGWLTGDLLYLIEHDEEIMPYLRFIEHPDDSQLSWLYENCLMTVYPSFYEGWGLPIAESLSHCKISLASNTSSMPEAGGRFADYFSPYSVSELEKLINKYSVSAVRSDREKSIKAGFKLTSWDDAAKEFATLADK